MIKKFLFYGSFMLVGGIIGWCLSGVFLNFSIAYLVATIGWLSIFVLGLMLFRATAVKEWHKKESKRVHQECIDIMEKTRNILEYYNGYSENMTENVSVYSDMVSQGVGAPIANTIISFSHELEDDNTVLLLNLDHKNRKWSMRLAGRPVYLPQLQAVIKLVEARIVSNSDSNGSIIINKQAEIYN
jgi:hypothetical protein